MLNITNITPPRVPIVDERTGLISREWYRFFLNLFTITYDTANNNLAYLETAPVQVDYTDSFRSQIENLQVTPPVQFGTLAYQNSDNVFVTRLSTVDPTTGTRNGSIYEDSSFLTLSGVNGVVAAYGTTPITVTQLTGFRPFVSNAYNLGTGSQRWASVYANEFLCGVAQQARYKEDSSFALIEGNNGVVMGVGTSGSAVGITVTQTTGFRPFADDAYNLGTGPQRWGNVYAVNGTIITSDATEKQQVRELSDAERRVALRIKSLIRAFKWNSSVAEKGDAARTHIGVMAQDVKAAFEAEGLDAHAYGMFCSDDIPTADGGVVSRLGVRYDQVMTFVLAAL